MMYLRCRGVSRDLDQAFELFQKAADQRYAVAQNNLALMYANGQSVPRVFPWAYAWLDLAAEQLSGCAELRDRIGKEMTSDEIARAREFAARKRVELEQQPKESK
jgi:TPR repeat protein